MSAQAVTVPKINMTTRADTHTLANTDGSTSASAVTVPNLKMNMTTSTGTLKKVTKSNAPR